MTLKPQCFDEIGWWMLLAVGFAAKWGHTEPGVHPLLVGPLLLVDAVTFVANTIWLLRDVLTGRRSENG